MISEITIPSMREEALPPPAWLVGCVVATVLFVGAAVLAAIPHEPLIRVKNAPVNEPVLHSGIVKASTPESAHADKSVPFHPTSIALPIL